MSFPGACGIMGLEPKIGAHLMEHRADGALVMATVTGITPNRWVHLTGPVHLGTAHAVAEIGIVGTDNGCQVSLTFRAFGIIDPDLPATFEAAWRELLTVRLKAFVEDGTRLGIEAREPKTWRDRNAIRCGDEPCRG